MPVFSAVTVSGCVDGKSMLEMVRQRFSRLLAGSLGLSGEASRDNCHSETSKPEGLTRIIGRRKAAWEAARLGEEKRSVGSSGWDNYAISGLHSPIERLSASATRNLCFLELASSLRHSDGCLTGKGKMLGRGAELVLRHN